jgi:hypothetical protein
MIGDDLKIVFQYKGCWYIGAKKLLIPVAAI